MNDILKNAFEQILVNDKMKFGKVRMKMNGLIDLIKLWQLENIIIVMKVKSVEF